MICASGAHILYICLQGFCYLKHQSDLGKGLQRSGMHNTWLLSPAHLPLAAIVSRTKSLNQTCLLLQFACNLCNLDMSRYVIILSPCWQWTWRRKQQPTPSLLQQQKPSQWPPCMLLQTLWVFQHFLPPLKDWNGNLVVPTWGSLLQERHCKHSSGYYCNQ